jgi:hypothetical protein
MIDFTNVFQGLVRLIQSGLRIELGRVSLCVALVYPLTSQAVSAGNSSLPNQIPVGVTDVYTVDENTTLNGNVITNDYDPDGDAIHVIAETINTAHGKVILNTNGSFTYTPNPNFHGEDTFDYQLCDDGDPVACCHGTVKITEVFVQEPPIANP